jgi:hypothetical protein
LSASRLVASPLCGAALQIESVFDVVWVHFCVCLSSE